MRGIDKIFEYILSADYILKAEKSVVNPCGEPALVLPPISS